MQYRRRIVPLGLALSLLFVGDGHSHSGSGLGDGFAAGLLHPVFGWDHVLAMVAVGLWGAVLGRPAIWILPVVFPLVMAVGAAFGVAGVALPAVEIGIALSCVVLGLLIALFTKVHLIPAMLIVTVFAVFHGHAHGSELPEAANPIAYAVGFVTSTGLLHLAGILLGLLMATGWGRPVVRTGGVVIAATGIFFLVRLWSG